MNEHRRCNGGSVNDNNEKPWDLKDDFKYAPKRPENDPWTTLFDSLIEQEKKRCEIWTNEIKNLLLFAGLFSGLVTAFILQSYKTLQPDPNADIVSLLQVIAHSANNGNSSFASTPSHSLLPPLPSSSFSASNGAVRVNICWFISLILSLTVVLSGIIVMQWLREHQSFTGHLPSSREMLAILNMRIEALERWYVQEIITTFPVTLAASLVLFFAGMIQFLHILGNATLLIAVASIITISLVLLSLSTVLPALQSVAMYLFPSLHAPPPLPCPYKSLQSGTFHAIGVFLISLLSKFSRGNKRALMYLSESCSRKTWAEIDLCWLSVRQACIFPESDEYHQFITDHNLPPLFDISKTFRDIIEGARVSPDVLAAAYYCFLELATPFVAGNNPLRRVIIKRDELDKTFKMILSRNQFLQSLLHRPCSSPDQSDHESHIQFETVDTRNQFFSNIMVLHHQNLFTFTDRMKNYQHAREFFRHHRVELGLRLGTSLYSRAHHLTHTHDKSFPAYLRGDLFNQHRLKILKNSVPVQVVQQYALVLMTFFENAARPDQPISDECLLAHKDTTLFLERAAWDMFRVVAKQTLANYSSEDKDKIVGSFGRVLERMSAILTETGAPLDDSNILFEKSMRFAKGHAHEHQLPANPLRFLLLAAIYVRRLNSYRVNNQIEITMDSLAASTLDGVIVAMIPYKRHVYDSKFDNDIKDPPQAGADVDLLHELDGKDRFGGVERFSKKWWTFLDGKHDLNCEDMGPFNGNPSPDKPPQTWRQTTLARLRRASTIVSFSASPISPTSEGFLPKYSEKSDDFVFPLQVESSTAESSRNIVPTIHVSDESNVSTQQEDIPMVPVSPSTKKPPVLRWRSASESATRPAASTPAFRSLRSVSFSMAKPQGTAGARNQSSFSSNPSPPVIYPDFPYRPDPNCVMSDDPYLADFVGY